MSIERSNADGTESIQAVPTNESALFSLGRVVATPGALEHCQKHNISPLALIARHQRGDWGDLCSADRVSNENALFSSGRLLSLYRVANKKLYVITEWDRSVSTLLLAQVRIPTNVTACTEDRDRLGLRASVGFRF